MTDNLGRLVLETGAQPFEIALADTDADEILKIRAELIRDNWDPFKVQAKNLLFLAFAMGVKLWDDEWPEITKRTWIANQWKFKALVGTEAALKMALDLWGYEVTQILRPPQGFYAGRDLTPEERNAWVLQMPQLRIRVVAQTGEAGPFEWFAGDSFVGEGAPCANDGPLLYGRRGYLRRDGVDIPLTSAVLSVTTRNSETRRVERISIPGKSTDGFFAGVDFAGEKFAGAAEVEASLVTAEFNDSTTEQDYTLGFNAITPGLEPLSTTFRRESDVGQAGPYFYAGDFAGDGFAGRDKEASEMLADVLYLFDQSVAVPMTEGISFAGVDRVGMPQKTAEIMIDLKVKAGAYEWFAGESFVGEGAAVAQDTRAMDNALRAVVEAKALRDTVLVNFAPERAVDFGDAITEDTTLSDWVGDLL